MSRNSKSKTVAQVFSSVATVVFFTVFLTALSGCGRKNRQPTLTPEQIEANIQRHNFLALAAQHFVEGNNFLRRGDTINAVRFFEAAFMLDTNSIILQNRVVELSIMAGVPGNAVGAIQRGRPLSEVEDEDLRRLTSIFMRFHAYPQAFEAISAIREKSRNDTIIIARMAMAENLIILGSLFNMRGQYDSAKIAFNRVLEIGIQTPEIFFGLGVASIRLNQPNDAKTYFKRVLELDPRHSTAANNLAFTWAQAGVNLEEAKYLVLMALEQEPDNGAYIDTHGWILFQMGQYEEALPLLLRASDLLPEEYIIFYHIGRTYLALGDKENALKFFKLANTFEENSNFEIIEQFIRDLTE